MENRLIIFDVDGVILKSDNLYSKISKKIFKTTASPQDFEKVITKGGQELFDTVAGRKADSSDIQLFRDSQSTFFDPQIHLYAEVIDTLLSLSKNNILAIVSNKPKLIIENILKKANIHCLFKIIIGLDSGFPEKPSPNGLMYIRRRYPTHIPVFVGDSYTDYQAAKHARINFIYCNYGFDNKVIEHQNKIEKISDLRLEYYL
jgi:HAD superfamily hydrolase (TIGR01549 family)